MPEAKSFIAMRSVMTGCRSNLLALSSAVIWYQVWYMRRPLMPCTVAPLKITSSARLSSMGREGIPSRDMRPPRRRILNPVRMASVRPAISRTTSTPVPPVLSITVPYTSSFLGSSTKSGFICLAILRRCSFTSSAKICVAPQARATAIENSPIGPQPVMATLLAAISPASNAVHTVLAGEDGRIFLRDGRIELPDIRLGNDDIFGEGAVGVHADDLHMLADVRFAGAALQALAAGHVHLGGNEIAFLDARYFVTDRFDRAAELVPGNQRRMNAALCPLVPLVNVQVGAAYGRHLDLDQYVGQAKLRFGNFADLRARRGLRLYHGKHRIWHESGSSAAERGGTSAQYGQKSGGQTDKSSTPRGAISEAVGAFC